MLISRVVLLLQCIDKKREQKYGRIILISSVLAEKV
jgi:hypothetical protein